MTTATGSAEAPREDWNEVTVETGHKLFRIDGMLHRILEKLGLAESKAFALADRGPDPDAVYDRESDLERGIRIGRSMRPQNFGSSGGETKWTTWVIGIVGVLIAAGVLGLTSAMFTMTGRMSSLETKVDMLIRDRP